MRFTALALVAPQLFVVTGALADTFDATRDQPMEETRHEARLRIKDGVARYDVQRAFHNAGTEHDEATLSISLPVGAAATGLRIKVGEHWLDGELMRRERAAELYQELTGIGPHAPKDPALLFWNWASQLGLRVFPVPPGHTATVGYALTTPTTYRDGRYFVSYPRFAPGGGLTSPAVRIDGPKPQIDGIAVDNASVWPLLVEIETPAWFGDRQPAPGASYTKSDIVIEEDEKTKKVSVSIDLQHTYRGDVMLELVSPDGAWHTLEDVEGGGENDVRKTIDVEFKEPVPTKGTWRLVVSDHAALDTGTLKKWSIDAVGSGDRHVVGTASDTPMFVPDAKQNGEDGQATISVDAPPIDTLATRLGSVPAAVDKEFFRLEIDTAAQLRPMPEDLHVVFVFDASLSLPADDMAPQIELARAFLSNTPDAKFEIVLARRHASRLLGRFAAAKDFDATIAAAEKDGKLDLGNGSALDAGVTAANAALRDRSGDKIVLLMTDSLLRPSWNNSFATDALKKAPDGTTTHVVLPTVGSHLPTDTRDDDHALAPIARRGGGILLRVDDISGPTKQLDALALGLVRPIRIDNLKIEGVTFDDNRELPTRLEEGDGVREMAMMTKAPKRITLRGHIWARPFEREIEATEPFSRATAAFVFSHDMHTDLTEEEMFRLAMTGRAVSPVTSYLAIEPGVRPSTAGLESIGMMGFGSGGGGLGGGIGLGGIGTLGGTPFDINKAMADDVKACVVAHSPKADWKAELKLLLTYEEIVDVEAPAGKFGQCLADAAWKVMLPSFEYNTERDTRVVSLP